MLYKNLKLGLLRIIHWPRNYWKQSWLHKLYLSLALLALLCLGTMYGIARWYIASQQGKPYVIGVSYIADYAKSLGLNPHKTMDALINDLHVRNFRLVSYWSDIEPQPGKYNFSELDWEFAQADKVHAHIMLSIGLRQPRWPECHPPQWVNTAAPMQTWYPQLKQYMTAVIERYKNNPALRSYQLENEYFLKAFGTCKNFSRQRLIDEYNLVKKLDPNHPIIISRSNNDLGIPINKPTPDKYGVSVYRRVWTPVLNRYIEYPFPSWYYAFLAGLQEIVQGKNMIIHEMQAEPWPPHGEPITSVSLQVQNQSFNAQRLENRFKYAKATGMHTIYFWGAEYWYYRLVKLHDPSVWNIAKQNFTSN